ncbi:hypothetical protein JCM1840_005952 [Sporobolomyces johnsonii]
MFRYREMKYTPFVASEPSSAAAGRSAAAPPDSPSEEPPAPRSKRRKRSKPTGNQEPKPLPVCAMCKAKKTRCDRSLPCSNCVVRSSPCTYGVVEPEQKIPPPNVFEQDAVGQAAQVKVNDCEVSKLFPRVKDLAIKLSISDEALMDLYCQASDELDQKKAEVAQPDEGTSVAPTLSAEVDPIKEEAKESTTATHTPETKKRNKDRRSSIDDETAPSTTLRRRTRATRQPHAPLSSPTPTRRKILPPPLPALDSSGQLPSPVDYHFPPGYRHRRRSSPDDSFEEELGSVSDSC